jgi:REP element-mobilizing transposase RayT
VRNRRDRRQKNTIILHATNRLTKGLPFVPNEYMQLLMLGVLARGQEMYPACVSHFLWMGNHYHMILVGRADQISPFLGYIQAEIAKALKQLCPRLYDSKIWRTRFKEQRLCTPEAVFKTISYLYNNPVKAGLVKSIDDYPGLSSWSMMRNGSHVIEAGWVPSRALYGFHKKIGRRSSVHLLCKLKQLVEENHLFRIHPFVWKKCFKETSTLTDEQLFKEIELHIRNREKEYALSQTRPVIGAIRLKRQSIFRSYYPKEKRYDRTPYLVCPDRNLRKLFIESYRYFCEQCSQAWRAVMRGELEVQFPQGAYIPGVPPDRFSFQ